jgi:glycerophosphoryl diester phosphodiesterase
MSVEKPWAAFWFRSVILALLLSGFAGFELEADAAEIKVIAHRGAHDLYPENTLAAIRRSIDLGCDYVEVDVRETWDGMLVLMHDSTVDRMTDSDGRVDEYSFAEIRKLKVKSSTGGGSDLTKTAVFR